MMSEKRFIVESVMIDCLCEDEPRIAKVITDTDETYSYEDLYEVAELLNEQQELIEELHISDHMGWGRAEHFEKELKQKKIYIKRLEYKVQKFKEENKQLKLTLSEYGVDLKAFEIFKQKIGYYDKVMNDE